MGVFTHKERANDVSAAAVVTNSLGDRQNMVFSKRALQGATPMATSAEAYQLSLVAYVRVAFVVGIFQGRNINQHLRRSGFSRQRVEGHIISCSGTHVMKKTLWIRLYHKNVFFAIFWNENEDFV